MTETSEFTREVRFHKGYDYRDDALKALALPYADHAEFNPAWRL